MGLWGRSVLDLEPLHLRSTAGRRQVHERSISGPRGAVSLSRDFLARGRARKSRPPVSGTGGAGGQSPPDMCAGPPCLRRWVSRLLGVSPIMSGSRVNDGASPSGSAASVATILQPGRDVDQRVGLVGPQGRTRLRRRCLRVNVAVPGIARDRRRAARPALVSVG
jgi:hypothetical protein